jgi:hypothetical protein
MIKHGYSQLPVIKYSDDGNNENREYYLITDNSILNFLSTFDMSTKDKSLMVEDAMVKVRRLYKEEDELFDLIEGMKEHGVALIIDSEGKLKHIVTNSDVAEYLRQWAEDILQVRDIELSLRRYILEAHKTINNGIDENSLQETINEVMPSTREFRKRFESALMRYLNKTNSEQKNNIRPSKDIIDDAFSELEKILEPQKRFSELTLDGYIKLFLHEKCWGRCSSAFKNMDRKNVSGMLEGIRSTRNRLAHFKEDEITALDRSQLRTCADWLAKHEKGAIKAFNLDAKKLEGSSG